MNGVMKCDRLILVATVAVSLLLATCPVSAATFAPTDVAGLVAAINAANANGQSDTIDLGGQTFTLTAVDNTIDGENGLPGVLPDGGSALTIRNGVIERDPAISPYFGPFFRFLHVNIGASLALHALTLRNGQSNGSGGAVYNLGSVSVSRSVLSRNISGTGGGIFNAGSLSVVDSMFSNQGSASFGGAIFNTGTLTVFGSTFSGNYADIFGAGVCSVEPGSAAIHTCTFTNNTAAAGSAIYSSSLILSMENSTVANNAAWDGPGGYLGAIVNDSAHGTFEIESCIVAANTAGTGPDVLNRGAAFASAKNNLIGVGEGSGIVNGVNGNQVGSLASPLNPLLGPLADNGGPTLTHALLAGSPAIDAGSNPAALANDQRGPGFSRVSGTQADVGAFELQSADLSVAKIDAPDPVIAGANLTWTVTVSNAGPDAAATVALVDTLPSGTTFVSLAAPGGWSCAVPAVGMNGTVSCSIASLPVGSATFTIVAAVDGGTPLGTVLSNTATVTSVTPDPDSADTSATATTTVISPALLSATKVVSGSFAPGGNVIYTIVLANAGPGAQVDNPGNELVDVLPSELALVSATAMSGTAVATTGTNTVTWNGSISAGGTVTITIGATVRSTTPLGASVSNQATISYDLDGNGTNETSGVSDDPATTTAGDPTVFVAVDAAIVPVLGGTGLGFLALLVALGGALVLGRRLS